MKKTNLPSLAFWVMAGWSLSCIRQCCLGATALLMQMPSALFFLTVSKLKSVCMFMCLCVSRENVRVCEGTQGFIGISVKKVKAQ